MINKSKTIFFVLAIVLLASISATPVFAILQRDLDAIINDSEYFEPKDNDLRGCVATGPEGPPPEPGDLEKNAEWIYKFLVNRDLTPIQAVGIMGNLKAESSMNPDAREPNGIGYGLAQWSFGRRDALEAAAQDQGVEVSDLAFQMNYLVNESMNRDSRSYPGLSEWEGLKRQDSVRAAVMYWEYNFERSADDPTKRERRVGFANEYLEQYGSSGTGSAGNHGEGCDPSNPGPRSSKIVGDPYEDSSSVPCPEGTRDLGVHEGYNGGNKFNVRLCSLSNLPSNSSADNPGTTYSTPGADGHAVVNSRVAGAWYTLIEDASKENINYTVNSSFRSMAHQEYLWDVNGRDSKYVARPGYSSHQAGVALDFDGMYAKGGSSCEDKASRPDVPGYLWLYNNSEKYGFKQYFAEAWHWDALPDSTRCKGP